ncbi:MAG: vWA domain-containing protein [Myxococcota bacterium]
MTVNTNPFVMTAHDPLSTFAVDVDSASYDIFRKAVNQGSLPPATSVRLEEFVNSFAYDYPAPTPEDPTPFSISLAAAPNLLPDGTFLLRVGIQARQAPLTERKGANLVFLVDVSGSMQSADKLPLVQQLMRESLDVLTPDDKISIVTYAGSTEVRLAPTAVRDRAEILAVINGLLSGGSTAGAAGLTLAYEQAQAGYIEGGLNHIVLCTDGDFNVGPSSNAELLNIIREKRKTGVTLTTLGFGLSNLNDSMMEAVSDAGNGIYGVISDSAHAQSYVQNKLLSTIVRVAKDAKIQVEFNAAQVQAYRLLGYEDRAIADNQFRDDTVDAGEIGSGHRVSAIYQLVPQGVPMPNVSGAPAAEDGAAYDGAVEHAANDLVLVKVRYKAPGAADTDAASEVAAHLTNEQLATEPAALDLDFRWAVAVASYAELLKGSPYANKASLPQIEALLKAPGQELHADRVEFLQLFTRASALLR